MPAAPLPSRTRADRCPGLGRPWIADDGALVRLRLLGGMLPRPTLGALFDVAETYGDGAVHLTRRANLQLRALPCAEDHLTAPVAEAVRATGLVPSESHELVRNYLLSPGSSATRADLRGVVTALDEAVRSRPSLARLSARFLFVLDDGSGDVLDRPCDLGLVAVSAEEAQLRVGADWGPVVPLAAAVPALLELAEEFVTARGCGPTAHWHVAELAQPLRPPVAPDPRLPAAADPPAYGAMAGDRAHVAVPDGRLTRELALPGGGDLVVTPWRSVVVQEVAA